MTLCGPTVQQPATTPVGQRYSGIVIFQSPDNTNTLNFAGQNSTQSSYNGTIYAPSAIVNLSGNSPSGTDFTNVISAGVTVTGSPGSNFDIGIAPPTPC